MRLRRLPLYLLVIFLVFCGYKYVERVRRFWVEASYLQCEFGKHCGWMKRSETLIVLNGNITTAGQGSYAAFRKVFTKKVKTIYLNSGGGSVSEAIKIANVVRDSGVDTVVAGACLSACSNYIFIAGKRKQIHGLLGFHGGAVGIYRHGPRRPDIDIADMAALANDEKAFFKSLNVDGTFVDISYRKDRGFIGQRFSFYAPDRRVLEKFGVKNLTGIQDPVLLSYLWVVDRLKGGVPQFGVGDNAVVDSYLKSRNGKSVLNVLDDKVEYGF